MFDTFFGLPLHPFVVHATEVTVPLAALLVIVAAAWPRFRRWAGYLPMGAALAALVLVPISTQSGEQLEAPRLRATQTNTANAAKAANMRGVMIDAVKTAPGPLTSRVSSASSV